MNPILYLPAEKNFASNGLGILSDAISCTVTEEANGVYDLTMQYPIDGIHFNDISDRCIIYAIPSPYRGPQPFRVKRITKQMSGTATVYAQHVSYDLDGLPCNMFSASSVQDALSAISENAAVTVPFDFWTDKTTNADFAMASPGSIRSILGGTDGSILDVFGGEYEFDHYTVKLYSKRGQDRGVTIRYGKNLTDIQQERNISNVYTGVYPYWVNTEGKLVICDPPIIEVEGDFDFVNVLTVDFSPEFSNPPTEEELREKTLEYIQANSLGTPAVSITATFEQLNGTAASLNQCDVCDTVTVIFERLGINVKAQIASIETDVLKERYNSVKIGSVKPNIVNTIVNQQKQIDGKPSTASVRQTAMAISSTGAGVDGGYKKELFDGNLPLGTMYMDAPKETDAAHIIRFDKSGISVLKDGKWTVMIGIDGMINPEWSSSWELNALKYLIGSKTLAQVTSSGVEASFDVAICGGKKLEPIKVQSVDGTERTVLAFPV